MKQYPSIALAGAIVLSASFGGAAVARSTNYSLDYSVSGAGGANGTSANYAVVSALKTEGVGGGQQSSSSYVFEPVVGLSDSPPARVTIWMVY